MCELLIDSKGFSSGSKASQPLYLRDLARQIARQFIHFTHRSVRRASANGAFTSERMPHIGGKVGCNTPTSRSLWAPHLRYPCRCWYKRAGSRRSCSKYHELVRALRQLAIVIPYADLHKGHDDLDDAGVGTSLWIANKLQ